MNWFVVAVVVSAGLALAGLLWRRRLLSTLRQDLPYRVPEFLLMNRRQIVDRLLADPVVQAAITEEAATAGTSTADMEQRARRYAREIAPRFSVFFYFGIGYVLSRFLLKLHYSDCRATFPPDMFTNLDPNATVILVPNHRSNMDVLLLLYLASRTSIVIGGAGEWSRLWPFKALVNLAGGYVVDRRTGDVLYRRVLARFLAQLTAAGVNQLVFPEGGLSRDARLQAPKLGVLHYVASAYADFPGRDIAFLPVGVNYDRVPEDNRLVTDRATEFRERGRFFLLRATAAYIKEVFTLLISRRRYRYGTACANFGRPLSWQEWVSWCGEDPANLDPAGHRRCLEELGQALMQRIEQLIPVTPLPLLAQICLDSPQYLTDSRQLTEAFAATTAAMREEGCPLAFVEEGEADRLAGAVGIFERLGVLNPVPGGGWELGASRGALLEYYANAIAHLR